MPDLTKDQMIKCFTDGYKKKSEWLIGTEHEKFGFLKNRWNLYLITKSLKFLIN